MNKFIRLFIISAALFLGVSAFAQADLPAFNGSASVGYTSRLIDSGMRVGDATTIVNVGLGYESFRLDFASYIPTLISRDRVRAHFGREDLTGSYRFVSSLVDLTLGARYQHFDDVGAGAVQSHLQPFVRLSDRLADFPVYVQARYDLRTKGVNLEGGAGVSFDVGMGVRAMPAVYVGYNDIADSLPRSVREIKADNRYYGATLSLERNVLGGVLKVMGGHNRADRSFANTTTYYSAQYSLTF